MKIISHAHISENGSFLNKELILDGSTENHLKELYQKLDLSYPKFYKMDDLSKMSVLGCELLLNQIDLEDSENNLQLVFANSSSSQLTDLKFIDSYTNLGAPSPSLFVYTLPNILTGELAIKHKWYGENTFFILPEFKADFYQEQIEFSFNRGNKYVICGWVEANSNGNAECFLFLVENNQELLDTNTIDQLYKHYKK